MHMGGIGHLYETEGGNAMRASKASLFLIELIILILFFAVAGGICVKLFVAAHLDSTSGENLSQAVLAVQSTAEAYKVAETEEQMLQYVPGAQMTEDGFEILYDAAWNPTQAAQAVFQVRVRMTERDGVGEAQIDALPYIAPEQRAQVADEPSIYTLTVKKLLY